MDKLKTSEVFLIYCAVVLFFIFGLVVGYSNGVYYTEDDYSGSIKVYINYHTTELNNVSFKYLLSEQDNGDCVVKTYAVNFKHDDRPYIFVYTSCVDTSENDVQLYEVMNGELVQVDF